MWITWFQYIFKKISDNFLLKYSGSLEFVWLSTPQKLKQLLFNNNVPEVLKKINNKKEFWNIKKILLKLIFFYISDGSFKYKF